jgi:hypothetical protein
MTHFVSSCMSFSHCNNERTNVGKDYQVFETLKNELWITKARENHKHLLE